MNRVREHPSTWVNIRGQPQQFQEFVRASRTRTGTYHRGKAWIVADMGKEQIDSQNSACRAVQQLLTLAIINRVQVWQVEGGWVVSAVMDELYADVSAKVRRCGACLAIDPTDLNPFMRNDL